MNPASARVVHLAIVQRSRVFADALATRLGLEPDLRVVRCATGPAAMRQAVRESSADVLLGDAGLFDPASIAAAPVRRLAAVGDGAPEPTSAPRIVPAVVLLADDVDRRMLATAVRAGVHGWVPNSTAVSDLASAIRDVADGGTRIPPMELSAVLEELIWSPPADPAQGLLDSLSPRERDVLGCLTEGLGRSEVAARLTMSTNTVRTHVQRILSKLGVNSSLAAVAIARRSTGHAGPATAPQAR